MWLKPIKEELQKQVIFISGQRHLVSCPVVCSQEAFGEYFLSSISDALVLSDVVWLHSIGRCRIETLS